MRAKVHHAPPEAPRTGAVEQLDVASSLGRKVAQLRPGAHQLSLRRQQLSARGIPRMEQLDDMVAGQAEAQLLAPQPAWADEQVDGHTHQRQRRQRASPQERVINLPGELVGSGCRTPSPASVAWRRTSQHLRS